MLGGNRAAESGPGADSGLPRVLFVCKGSATDGLGHITRTRAVAAAMPQGVDAHVIAIGGAAVRNLLEGRRNCTVVKGVEDATGLAAQFRPDLAVFDLLGLGSREFEMLACSASTVSLSPVFSCMDRVDALFHRTVIPDPGWHELPKLPLLRMGLEYAVVDADTRKIASQVFDQTLARNRLSVAVSMGGVDAANKTLGVLETLRSSRSRLLLWVMLGEGYEHSYEDLVDCARGARHEIVLAKTNESMWHILGTCGLAILAGGTTTYQAAYAGLPSLNILESPERRFLLQELVDKGACLRAGDDLENSLARLNDLVEHFDAHRDELLQMHQNASLLIDGNGARRIAHEIAQMAGAGMASR